MDIKLLLFHFLRPSQEKRGGGKDPGLSFEEEFDFVTFWFNYEMTIFLP